MSRKLLVACGIVASLLYVAMTVAAPFRFPGYSSLSQTISELSAVDAPSRRLWMALGIFYTPLMIAFGWGVWESAAANRALRVSGALLLVYAASGLLWPFAPMHLRPVLAAGGGTWQDTMHLVLSGVTVAIMLVAMGFGAAALGRGFRIYTIATMAIQLVFGTLTGADGARVSADLPTPWVGLWERIALGAFLFWVAVLAVRLLVPSLSRRLQLRVPATAWGA